MNNKGNTMFETLIAFVVLTIILAIVYQMVAFCGELRMKATDTDMIVSDFNENIYKKSVPEDLIDVADRHSEVDINGPLFYLRLSDETSSSKNIKSDVDYTANSYRIRMSYLSAKTYVSKDPRIESEKLVTPKALQFYYYK